MHCLSSVFSSLPCSDTGEVCLAVSGTGLSSNQPATTMATIISASVFSLFFGHLVRTMLSVHSRSVSGVEAEALF